MQNSTSTLPIDNCLLPRSRSSNLDTVSWTMSSQCASSTRGAQFDHCTRLSLCDSKSDFFNDKLVVTVDCCFGRSDYFACQLCEAAWVSLTSPLLQYTQDKKLLYGLFGRYIFVSLDKTQIWWCVYGQVKWCLVSLCYFSPFLNISQMGFGTAIFNIDKCEMIPLQIIISYSRCPVSPRLNDVDLHRCGKGQTGRHTIYYIINVVVYNCFIQQSRDRSRL